MLRFDRYVIRKGLAIDLATANPVEIERGAEGREPLALFESHAGRTLIDRDAVANGCVEIWERWQPGRTPPVWPSMRTDFVEILECARLGAPRAFDLAQADRRQYDFLRRALAREARTRGWIPVGAEMLGHLGRIGGPRLAPLLADRSLVIFVEAGGLSGEAVVALLRLAQRDARPHVLVRSLPKPAALLPWATSRETAVLHEGVTAFTYPATESTSPDLQDEARARWALMLQTATGGVRDAQVLALARVLAARDQSFEARALVAPLAGRAPDQSAPAAAVATTINERALARVGHRLSRLDAQADLAQGWEMIDEVVGVLQLCQDIEDEQMALARVGAFVRDRLQASSVAVLARDGGATRVLARIGSDAAPLTIADRAIETGVTVPPAHADGPVETACPIRHAADVIGALWCRWSAGMPVAMPHAATLLGVASAAVAPSVRLALTRPAAAPRVNPVPELIGESPAIVTVRDAIVRAAASPFPVVIEGESGCGKELVARAIHTRSVRRSRRFCPINCAALVDELAESELFGHVRGAFTGASSDRAGVFEEANGGTLFLDEIADLGGRVQAKLLRALQEGEIRRLGETAVRKVDVRIVAASNQPLATQVANGDFRADLWYRLNVIRLTLPPLRARLDDVPILVAHVWETLQMRTGSKARLSAAALAALSAYDWPGNVRELQNVLASMLVAASRSGVVGPSALPSHVARAAAVIEPLATLAAARRQFEERYVRAALARAGGRTTMAARDLGLSRQGMAKLLGRLGISDARHEMPPSANVQ